MRICTLLFFFISALTCHPLCAHNPTGHYFLTQDSTSSLTSSALPAKPKKTKELFQQNFSYMGIPFIVSGLIVKNKTKVSVHCAIASSRLFTTNMTIIHNMSR